MWLFLQTKKRLDEGVNRFFILRGLHVFEVHEDGVVLIVVTADAVDEGVGGVDGGHGWDA